MRGYVQMYVHVHASTRRLEVNLKYCSSKATHLVFFLVGPGSHLQARPDDQWAPRICLSPVLELHSLLQNTLPHMANTVLGVKLRSLCFTASKVSTELSPSTPDLAVLEFNINRIMNYVVLLTRWGASYWHLMATRGRSHVCLKIRPLICFTCSSWTHTHVHTTCTNCSWWAWWFKWEVSHACVFNHMVLNWWHHLGEVMGNFREVQACWQKFHGGLALRVYSQLI